MDDGNLPDFEYLGEQRLDPFADSKRRMPSEFVRSTLFNVRNRNKPREFLRDVQLPSSSDFTILYRGDDLRQDDAKVYFHMINLAKNQPLGSVIEFSAYSFCKEIGWDTSGKSYQRLRQCLKRMQATSLEIQSKNHRRAVSMSLISEFDCEDQTGEPLSHYRVSLPKKLIALFGDYGFTQIEWEQRLKLSDGLVSWLYNLLKIFLTTIHFDPIL